MEGILEKQMTYEEALELANSSAENQAEWLNDKIIVLETHIVDSSKQMQPKRREALLEELNSIQDLTLDNLITFINDHQHHDETSVISPCLDLEKKSLRIFLRRRKMVLK